MTTQVLTPTPLTGTQPTVTDRRPWVAVVCVLAIALSAVVGLTNTSAPDGGHNPELAPVSWQDVLSGPDRGIRSDL